MPQCSQRTIDSTVFCWFCCFLTCLGSLPSGWLRSLWRAMMRAASKPPIMTMIQNNTFPTQASSENNVEHEAAAGIGQQHESKTHQRPAQGNAPAPAARVAAQQQPAKG